MCVAQNMKNTAIKQDKVKGIPLNSYTLIENFLKFQILKIE